MNARILACALVGACFDPSAHASQELASAPFDRLAPPADAPARVRRQRPDLELPAGRERVDFDEVEGVLWARGANYKARFDERVQFTPFLSSKAPRNYPLELRLAALECGERSVEFDSRVRPRSEGTQVRYERGALVERYDLAPRGMEQSFVVPRPLGDGALKFTLRVETELTPVRDGAGWRFSNEFGAAGYGAAKAIDARGCELELESEWEGGELSLLVPAEFARDASYPLLVDPLIAAFGIEATPAESFSPDLCFDASGQAVLHVWQSEFSASDHDVWADMYSPSGAPLYRGGWIDMTANFWARPRCANNGATNRFLVVAHVLNASTGRIEVWGRTRDVNTALLSPQFKIAGGASFDLLNPDVGGDPYPSGPSYFLVAYERIYSFGADHDLHGKLVTDGGAVLTGTVNIDLSIGTFDSLVSVSRSNSGSRWNLAWQRASPAGGNDIFGARVQWNGAVTSASFPIAVTGVDHTSPAVSPSQGASERWIVAYEEDFGSDHDIIVSGLDGASVTASVNLSSYDGPYWYQDQRWPCVDTDGSRFVCVYSELYGSSAVDYDVYASEVLFNGASLAAVVAHQPIAADYGIERDARIAAQESSQPAADSRTFAISLAREPDSAAYFSFDILGARYDAGVGGAVASFCDGASVVCPCGNGASTVGGCPNSSSPSGAHLSFGGIAATGADTLQLFCSGMPAGVSCLFFQGAGSINGAAGAPFGDGVRCAASPVRRLGTKSTSAAGGALFPGVGDASLSIAGAIPPAGATVVYQVWYRNPANYCTSETTNYSNALVAAWAP